MSVAIVTDRASSGARRLSEEMDVYRIRPERAARLRHSTYINWGVGEAFTTKRGVSVLNPPQVVRASVDKLAAFSRVASAHPNLVPEWSLTRPTRSGRSIWLARRNGLQEGRGITVVRPDEEFPPADFYVKYIQKTAEYRVHVVLGQVIHIQQKRRRNGAEQTDNQKLIRNYDNGWVFVVNDIAFPNAETEQALRSAAINSVNAVGLDFAAVDLIVQRDTNNVFFLETNSRPAIEADSTAAAYAAAFNRFL